MLGPYFEKESLYMVEKMLENSSVSVEIRALKALKFLGGIMTL